MNTHAELSSLSPIFLTSNAIEHRPIVALVPYANNPRTHSRKQVKQIAASMREFGFVNPILVDANNTVIAGHGRLEAARLLNLATVPTLRIDHLTDAQKRAYIIADNRIAEKAGWDKEILSLELHALIDLDFEVQLTGFETPEIDILLSSESTGDAKDDEFEPASDGPPISQSGDLWLLGQHRLYCGDATLKTSYEFALGGEKAQMVFTDPPYNVR